MLDIFPDYLLLVLAWSGFVISLLRSRRRLATLAVGVLCGTVGRIVGIVILSWLFPRSGDGMPHFLDDFEGLVATICMWFHAKHTREQDAGGLRS